MTSHQELEDLLKKIRYDATAIQGTVSELLRQITTIDLPDTPQRTACPECGLSFSGRWSQINHRYTSHEIPWAEVERVEAELKAEATERKRLEEERETVA